MTPPSLSKTGQNLGNGALGELGTHASKLGHQAAVALLWQQAASSKHTHTTHTHINQSISHRTRNDTPSLLPERSSPVDIKYHHSYRARQTGSVPAG